MNHDIENKVRAALAEQANSITPATLRHTDLPSPRPRRLPAPVVAAAVVALLVIGSLTTAALRTSNTALASRVPTVTVGAVLPSSGGYTLVDGIAIPTPPGWSITEMKPRAGARQLCLTDDEPADPGCTDGMALTVASTIDGRTATITTRPPDLCPDAKQIMTYNPEATIDQRPAIEYQIQCDGHGPIAEYWQLTDQTLAISTPLTGQPQIYEHIIAGIDLTGWAHQP